MNGKGMDIHDKVTVELQQLDALLQALTQRGYQLVGPTLREGAIAYDCLTSVKDLPAGWTDEQDGGTYRLKPRTDFALFGYAVGPHSWKKFLHPANHRLWHAKREGNGFKIMPEQDAPPKYAFIGARSCDLHAIAVQDKVFMGGRFIDPIYKSRRENIFVVAVNCSHAGGTCFCVSMNTGPKATFGYDIALTEII
ncbi:MAG: sulfite reductase subunit A, partial [Limisphaerales bacterium]